MSAKTKGKEIVIPSVNLAQISIKIRGVTPLITNKFPESTKKAIEEKQGMKAKAASNKGRGARDPEKEFKESLYEVPGQPDVYGLPAGGIKKALVTAGGRFTEQKMTILRGAFSITGEVIPILGSKPQMRTDVVRLQGMGRPADLRYRAEFRKWSMDIPIIFNADIVSVDQVVGLFQICGFSVGFGDWRPECNGIYGQFEVVNE